MESDKDKLIYLRSSYDFVWHTHGQFSIDGTGLSQYVRTSHSIISARIKLSLPLPLNKHGDHYNMTYTKIRYLMFNIAVSTTWIIHMEVYIVNIWTKWQMKMDISGQTKQDTTRITHHTHSMCFIFFLVIYLYIPFNIDLILSMSTLLQGAPSSFTSISSRINVANPWFSFTWELLYKISPWLFQSINVTSCCEAIMDSCHLFHDFHQNGTLVGLTKEA